MSKHTERVEKFLKEREAMLGLDPELIHGLHTGTEREAELLTSDLRALLSERAALLALARAVSKHFAHTDAQLGLLADTLIDHAEG